MAIKHCIEAILCHFLLGSNFHPSETHFGLKNCHFKWSHAKLNVGHLYLLLVMWEDLILTYKVAQFWFAIFSCYSGLYDLGIQTKVNFWWNSFRWPQTNEKRIKFWFSIVSGLWFGLRDLHWPFTIFLRSLMPKESSSMQ